MKHKRQTHAIMDAMDAFRLLIRNLVERNQLMVNSGDK